MISQYSFRRNGCILVSRGCIYVTLTVSADQNTLVLLNERITDHGKRSFEWSSNWTAKKNVFSNWTLKEVPSRTRRLLLVRYVPKSDLAFAELIYRISTFLLAHP